MINRFREKILPYRVKYDIFYKLNEAEKGLINLETWINDYAIPTIGDNLTDLTIIHDKLKKEIDPLITELNEMVKKALSLSITAKKKADKLLSVFDHAAVELDVDVYYLEQGAIKFKNTLLSEFNRIKDAFVELGGDLKDATQYILNDMKEAATAMGDAARETKVPLLKVVEHIKKIYPVKDITQLVTNFYDVFMAMSYLTYLPTGGQYAVLWEVVEGFVEVTREFKDISLGFERMGNIFKTAPAHVGTKMKLSFDNIENGINELIYSFGYVIKHLSYNLLNEQENADNTKKDWLTKKNLLTKKNEDLSSQDISISNRMFNERTESLKIIKSPVLKPDYPSFAMVPFEPIGLVGKEAFLSPEEKAYWALKSKCDHGGCSQAEKIKFLKMQEDRIKRIQKAKEDEAKRVKEAEIKRMADLKKRDPEKYYWTLKFKCDHGGCSTAEKWEFIELQEKRKRDADNAKAAAERKKMNDLKKQDPEKYYWTLKSKCDHGGCSTAEKWEFVKLNEARAKQKPPAPRPPTPPMMPGVRAPIRPPAPKPVHRTPLEKRIAAKCSILIFLISITSYLSLMIMM